MTTSALLGVLATGGLPVLALNLTSDEAVTDAATPSTTDPGGPPSEPPGKAAGRDKDDPRATAKPPKKAKQEGKGSSGEPGWARRTEVPPGWAKNHGGQRPYGWAVREWAHCMADAAAKQGQGQRANPSTTCGEKPAKPDKAAKPGKAAKPDKAGKPSDAGRPDKAAKPNNAGKPSALAG